ncbi:MAG: GNAT family N-acetyltransferase [Desulfobacula sp.]|nr:GNAT family N-acetyltransferase [Desulfobacula sp.]MDA8133257.1 GNAT family N-acetyltransferase [Desulfobacteraceae bacterium]
MNQPFIRIRLMSEEDFDDVVRIDQKILGVSRLEYYKLKFELLFKSGEYLPTSLVAEDKDGNLVGFIMGELYIGEFGISREGASIDTVGVNPDCRRQGIGKRLMTEFVEHLKQLGVQKINTLVEKEDARLMNYFNANLFSPSKAVINLERSI